MAVQAVDKEQIKTTQPIGYAALSSGGSPPLSKTRQKIKP